MYLSAALEREGYDVFIIDFAGNPKWREAVQALNADLFGITCVTPNFKTVREISSLLPKDVPLVVGGVHPTFLPQDVLANIRCDAIVQGEGETVILQLVEDLRNGSLKRIYHGGIVPVESVPKPSRHLVNLHGYTPGGEQTTPVYTSRGCPYTNA